MADKNRRKEDHLTEPQTMEEFTRQIWRDVKDIRSVTFGSEGTGGLCDRMTTIETIVAVMKWVVGIAVPIGGLALAWLTFFK